MRSDATAAPPPIVPSPPPTIPFRSEVARKATHMFALIIPVGYWVLRLDRGSMLAIMIPIALLMVLIDVARLRNWTLWHTLFSPVFGRMIRAHEQAGDFTGATYILASTVATVALFAKPVAIAALAFIVVGDTLAAIIGRRFGRHKFLRNKTLEGSIACLVGTVGVALVSPGLTLPVALIGALTATIVEALPLQVDDNVTVPLLSGLVMTLLVKAPI